jgi:hypothetical protein
MVQGCRGGSCARPKKGATSFKGFKVQGSKSGFDIANSVEAVAGIKVRAMSPYGRFWQLSKLVQMSKVGDSRKAKRINEL